jgi:1,6-anhydro-N-acetylmuramate kinase
LRMSDGHRDWLLGTGDPGTSLTAGRNELFRAITGRRTVSAIRAYDWSGDPSPYLAIISPYPLPADRLAAH